MTLAAAIELEQHLDPGGDTIGWLARYGENRALWCGEMSRADFMRESTETRIALCDDLGWYLLDLDHSHPVPKVRVLARVCKPSALDVLRVVLLGRLCERQQPKLCVEALRIVGSGPPSPDSIPPAFLAAT